MRVLVVEDEVHLAQAVGRGLTSEGFDVDLVHDGLEGLQRAREGSYGAMVLDILLPGMNGYLVCRTLRDEGNWTPILMLTAKDGEYDEAEALDTGADDYLSKPFSFVVLVARLHALARRSTSSGSVSVRLAVGDLELDPVSRVCQRGGTAVDLTRREAALLESLLRRPGEVVSKRTLAHEVWGGDDDSNVVEVYIGYLRRKVDMPFGRRSLETARGRGYRVIDDGAGQNNGAGQGDGAGQDDVDR